MRPHMMRSSPVSSRVQSSKNYTFLSNVYSTDFLLLLFGCLGGTGVSIPNFHEPRGHRRVADRKALAAEHSPGENEQQSCFMHMQGSGLGTPLRART